MEELGLKQPSSKTIQDLYRKITRFEMSGYPYSLNSSDFLINSRRLITLSESVRLIVWEPCLNINDFDLIKGIIFYSTRRLKKRFTGVWKYHSYNLKTNSPEHEARYRNQLSFFNFSINYLMDSINYLNTELTMNAPEYKQAINRIDELFDKQEAAMEWTEVERWEFVYLTIEVEKYEAIHYPRPLPHPIEAIKIRMRDLGWSIQGLSIQSDIDIFPIHEVLEGRGKLSLPMIRAFNKLLTIPLEVLIQDYD